MTLIDAPVVAASYFICCLPRSGSWLLADGLKATKVAGVPEEYYWDEFYADYCGRWGVPPFTGFGEFVAQTQRVGTSPNGVFGAKLHWDELAQLVESLQTLPGTLQLDEFELLSRFFPKLNFIYLYRADKVRQAISWFRAGTTANWYSVQGERRRTVELQPDWDRILQLEWKLRSDEQAWRDFFSSAGLVPVCVAYEDLTRDYRSALNRVLAAIDVQLPLDFVHPQPRLQQQRSSVTEEWVQRYLVERRRLWPADDELYGRLG